MKTLSVAVVLLVSAIRVCAGDVGPFETLIAHSSTAEERLCATEASDDFAAVLAFKEPIHAKSDGFYIKDGGSMVYKAKGYRIIVWHQFCHDGLIIYGPEVAFDQTVFRNVRSSISHTAIYERSDLNTKLETKRANQALVPTATTVTPAADAPVAPPAAAAHL